MVRHGVDTHRLIDLISHQSHVIILTKTDADEVVVSLNFSLNYYTLRLNDRRSSLKWCLTLYSSKSVWSSAGIIECDVYQVGSQCITEKDSKGRKCRQLILFTLHQALHFVLQSQSLSQERRTTSLTHSLSIIFWLKLDTWMSMYFIQVITHQDQITWSLILSPRHSFYYCVAITLSFLVYSCPITLSLWFDIA